MERAALREALGNELVELARKDERIVVLDADLATSTKVDTFSRVFPERFFQMGVTEQNMIGVAAGISTLGYIPFVSTFACFVAKRTLDQIRLVVAQPRLNVKLLACYTGLFTGRSGKTHQTVQDLAIMRSMPNMRVVVPGDAVEMVEVLKAVVEYEGPVYIRVARDPSPVFLPEDYKFKWGKPHTVRKGKDLTIICMGITTWRAIELAEELAREGIECRIEHVASLKPLDPEAIAGIASESRCIVTIENHSILGGLGGAVAEILAESRPTLMKRIGINDTYAESGSNDELAEKYGFGLGKMKRDCLDLLEKCR